MGHEYQINNTMTTEVDQQHLIITTTAPIPVIKKKINEQTLCTNLDSRIFEHIAGNDGGYR